jgi:hypothetical protein
MAAPQLSLKAQTSAVATVEGAAVDMQSWREAVIVLNCGTCDASTTLNVKIEEDTAAAFDDDPQDVTSAAFAEVDATNDDAIFVGRLNSDALTDRFIRVTAVIGGSGSALFSAVIIPYGPMGSQSELPATLGFDL